jgi:cell division protein FtsI (penicillin-binding protein 3)
MLFVLTLFGGRLVQLQGLDGPAVAALALAKRTTTVELPAHRGDIVDADGHTLATTVDRPNLLIDQTLVTQTKKLVGGREVVVGIEGAAQELSKVLGVPAAQLVPKLTGTSRGAMLAKGVTPEAAREVLRLPIPGTGLDPASRRVYPGGTTAANVLGFVRTADGKALDGIELRRDGVLAGRPGWLQYEHAGNDQRTRIPTGVTDENEPQPGRTVQLTIVRDLQWRAQQAIEAQVRATGSESGTVVILDRTSKILALATAPTFDPNNYGAARDADRGNRPLLDVFEPGSTAKVVTMAAALEEKAVTPTTRITVPPTLRRGGTVFHDAETHGTEQLTVNGVLAQSSNIGTIEVGERVPAAKMYDYMRRFGLGTKTGVELNESAGLLEPYQKWTDSQRYTLMFGQGISTTALQAANVFATIANGGVRMQPQLVAGERDADGVFHPDSRPDGVQVVSSETAQQLRLMMENVVGKNGTAEKANVAGYRVAGKTGTSQMADKGVYRSDWYTASFIGMAPADDPQLVIAVILQKPMKGHYGGEVAAPVFQELMTAALLQRKVPPTGTKPPEIPIRWR